MFIKGKHRALAYSIHVCIHPSSQPFSHAAIHHTEVFSRLMYTHSCTGTVESCSGLTYAVKMSGRNGSHAKLCHRHITGQGIGQSCAYQSRYPRWYAQTGCFTDSHRLAEGKPEGCAGKAWTVAVKSRGSEM